jgi:hypothetical protein
VSDCESPYDSLESGQIFTAYVLPSVVHATCTAMLQCLCLLRLRNSPWVLLQLLSAGYRLPLDTMPFVYSAIARGQTVLAQYTSYTGNIPEVAQDLLGKLQQRSGKTTVSAEQHNFNFLFHDPYSTLLYLLKPT